ncbi:hypothetical protein D3C86_778600 [compost metagenome]
MSFSIQVVASFGCRWQASAQSGMATTDWFRPSSSIARASLGLSLFQESAYLVGEQLGLVVMNIVTRVVNLDGLDARVEIAHVFDHCRL